MSLVLHANPQLVHLTEVLQDECDGVFNRAILVAGGGGEKERRGEGGGEKERREERGGTEEGAEADKDEGGRGWDKT